MIFEREQWTTFEKGNFLIIPIFTKELISIIRNLPTKEVPDSSGFICDYYQTFK